MTDHSSLQKEKNNTDIVERLNNTPNWMRATMSWKDCVLTYDRAPFEAAADIVPQAAPAPEPSVCGLTECKNRTKCDCCKAWDSMGI